MSDTAHPFTDTLDTLLGAIKNCASSARDTVSATDAQACAAAAKDLAEAYRHLVD